MIRVDTVSDTRPGKVCANEGCARRPEPGEEYCSVCCLEWTLFRRDERCPESRGSALRGWEAERR
jgi:hypothetical protein